MARISVAWILVLFIGCTDSEIGSEKIAPQAIDEMTMDTEMEMGSEKPAVIVAGDAGSVPIESAFTIGELRLGRTPQEVCPVDFQNVAPIPGRNRFQVSDPNGAGERREFYIDIPNAEEFVGPRPLIVAFNGTSGDGSFINYLGEFKKRGFILLGPSSDAYGRVYPWWDSIRTPEIAADRNPDVEYFHHLVECVSAHFSVDTARIYVGGFSAGGGFTNAILQRYSKYLAGGVAGSGVFDLTAPTPVMELDPMFVIVYFGGLNDHFGPFADVLPGPFPFSEQASRASVFYENDPNVAQTTCYSDKGHTWPAELEAYFADELLAHPKGSVLDDKVARPAPNSAYLCGADPVIVEYDDEPPTCAAGNIDACQEFCQDTSDCVSRNISVGTTMRPRLEELGLGGPDTCGDCTQRCEAIVGDESDILSCIANRSQNCGPGLDGFLPYRDALQECCRGRENTGVCAQLCSGFTRGNILGAAFFPDC